MYIASVPAIHHNSRFPVSLLCLLNWKVGRQDLEAFLSTHEDKVLRSAAARLLVEAELPGRCGWGAAVGLLRQNSGLFVDLNLKVRRRR